MQNEPFGFMKVPLLTSPRTLATRGGASHSAFNLTLWRGGYGPPPKHYVCFAHGAENGAARRHACGRWPPTLFELAEPAGLDSALDGLGN